MKTLVKNTVICGLLVGFVLLGFTDLYKPVYNWVVNLTHKAQPKPIGDDTPLIIVNKKVVPADDIIAPSVSIAGAEKPFELGELILLDSKLSNYGKEYVTNISYKWSLSDNKRFIQEGTGIVFTSGVKPSSGQATVVVTIVYNVNGQKVTRKTQAVVTVQVGDNKPVPLPDNVSTTAKNCQSWALAVKLPADVFVRSAKDIASNYRTVAKNANANTNIHISDMLKQVSQKNHDSYVTTGAKNNEWQPFFLNLKDYAMTLYKNGKLDNVDQCVQLFNDIASGIEAAIPNGG